VQTLAHLGRGDDVDAAIALPAGLVVILTDGVLFAVADYIELC
jgi:hypothetical protein